MWWRNGRVRKSVPFGLSARCASGSAGEREGMCSRVFMEMMRS